MRSLCYFTTTAMPLVTATVILFVVAVAIILNTTTAAINDDNVVNDYNHSNRTLARVKLVHMNRTRNVLRHHRLRRGVNHDLDKGRDRRLYYRVLIINDMALTQKFFSKDPRQTIDMNLQVLSKVQDFFEELDIHIYVTRIVTWTTKDQIGEQNTLADLVDAISNELPGLMGKDNYAAAVLFTGERFHANHYRY